MSKFEKISDEHITKEFENALNGALKSLNIEGSIVFDRIILQKKDNSDCKKPVLERDENGKLVCRWVDC